MSDDKALIDRQTELADMFQLFNETTEKLQTSHDGLQLEVARLRAELEEKNAELNRKSRLAALGEMAAGMAHEIRNPLGAIQLYASLLERDLTSGGPQELTRKINAGVRHLDGIVEAILAFAREREPDLAPCGLEAVVATVLADLHPQAEQAGVAVVWISGGVDDRLVADERLIERAIANVVLNAIQATPAGGQVTVKSGQIDRGEGPALSLDVTDTGCGLDNAAQDKIFNPFYTSKDSGTGLGLAIVHRIVEAHGGSISARDNVGPGATFTLRLPRTGRPTRLNEMKEQIG